MPLPSPTYITSVLPPRPKPFTIYLNGVRWSGDWLLIGKELCVRSAYGGLSKPCGRRKPHLLAEEMLVEILRVKLAELEAATSESCAVEPKCR